MKFEDPQNHNPQESRKDNEFVEKNKTDNASSIREENNDFQESAELDEKEKTGKIKDLREKLGEGEQSQESSKTEQGTESYENECRMLTEEINHAIEETDDPVFTEGAEEIKKLLTKGIEKAKEQRKDIEFISNYIKYVREFKLKSLIRLMGSTGDMVADKKTRLKFWREQGRNELI